MATKELIARENKRKRDETKREQDAERARQAQALKGPGNIAHTAILEPERIEQEARIPLPQPLVRPGNSSPSFPSIPRNSGAPLTPFVPPAPTLERPPSNRFEHTPLGEGGRPLIEVGPHHRATQAFFEAAPGVAKNIASGVGNVASNVASGIGTGLSNFARGFGLPAARQQAAIDQVRANIAAQQTMNQLRQMQTALAAFNVQDAQLTVKAQQNYHAYKRRAEALAPYVKEVLKEKQATAKANEEIPPSAPNQEIMTLAKERYDAVFGNDPAMQFTDMDDLTATRVARAKELNLKLGLLTGEMQGQLTLDEQKRVNQARVEMMKGLAQQQQANPPIPPQALAGQGAGGQQAPGPFAGFQGQPGFQQGAIPIESTTALGGGPRGGNVRNRVTPLNPPKGFRLFPGETLESMSARRRWTELKEKENELSQQQSFDVAEEQRKESAEIRKEGRAEKTGIRENGNRFFNNLSQDMKDLVLGAGHDPMAVTSQQIQSLATKAGKEAVSPYFEEAGQAVQNVLLSKKGDLRKNAKASHVADAIKFLQAQAIETSVARVEGGKQARDFRTAGKLLGELTTLQALGQGLFADTLLGRFGKATDAAFQDRIKSDDRYVQYEKLRKGLLATFAKGISDEVGNLSKFDQEIAEQLTSVPGFGFFALPESKSVFNKNLEFLKHTVLTGFSPDRRAQLGGITQEFVELNKGLYGSEVKKETDALLDKWHEEALKTIEEQ